MKASISYVVVSWLIIRIVSLLGDILEAPIWVTKGVFFLLLAGFPICILIAWIYELTPNGIKRTSQVSESVSLRKKGILLDPVNQNNYHGLANAYYYNKQYKKAETLIRESLDLDPNQECSYFLLAILLQMQGRYDAALVIPKKNLLKVFCLIQKL